nr:tyrosine-protein phosphatase non-receptor type 13 [Parasteatoda tepidariorum]
MVSYHCSMPVLENVQVSLNEILEVRGNPLKEYELWGLLFQTTQAVQDIFLRGHANEDGVPQYLVTPDNLLCTSTGRVILSVSQLEIIKKSQSWCDELEDKNICSQSEILEKIYVFSIGQTIFRAAYFSISDKSQNKLSPLIRTVFQGLCQKDIDLRMTLSDVIQVCTLHAEKYMDGCTFSNVIVKLHQEVLGSLPENEILSQVDQDILRENEADDLKNANKEMLDLDYSVKYLSYGHRLGYHPEISVNINAGNILTAKERWKKAYHGVREQILKSKLHISTKDEVLKNWQEHKAHQSILRVYEELTERRKMLELLRLSINIGPSAPVDVDTNLLTTGLKPKTIAELVLLLQRPAKQPAISSKSHTEVQNDNRASSSSDSQFAFSSNSSTSDEECPRQHYYNIQEVALKQPFSTDSESQFLMGPEFVINQLKPPEHASPFCKDEDIKKFAFTVVVHLLSGETIEIECVPSTNGKQLMQFISDKLNLQERYLFGLVFNYGGEYTFLEKKQRIRDLLRYDANSTIFSNNMMQLYLRVKFYIDDIHLMRTMKLRHLFYLQLRRDFLDGHFYCDNDLAFNLGSIALQSEFGNYDSSVHGKEYFLLEHYLPFSIIKQFNRNDAKIKLSRQHDLLKGVSKQMSELKFIQAYMKSPEYGSHFYKVYQDKRNLSSAVWLGIRPIGIDVYDNISGKRTVTQTYSWQNIKRISFSKKYFCIAPSNENHFGKHVIYKFYTAELSRSQYLFSMSMAHHKFFLKLRSVSKASEIFSEDLEEDHLCDCSKIETEKEMVCDLYDSHENCLLNEKTVNSSPKPLNESQFRNTLPLLSRDRYSKASPKRVVRSSSDPYPGKRRKSEYFSIVSSTKELRTKIPHTIPRTTCEKRSMKLVKLQKDSKYGFGMVITCGNTYETVLHGAFVESVHPGSPADQDGNISPGDQIMFVNGTDVQHDNFMTVVDLLQHSANPVELVVAKANKVNGIPNFIEKEVIEKPFTKAKAWICGDEEKVISTAIESSDFKSENMPIPQPRKKWVDQNKPVNFDVPDLTLNHATKLISDHSWKEETNNGLNGHRPRDNIPDIIASQLKYESEPVSSNLSKEDISESELYSELSENVDDNFLLPGEVFHVVLDKKNGSLGLNIYQGTEQGAISEQRHIFIHSVIPQGAADLDGRIKRGDKLIEVNGVLLENLSYEEVVTKLRESPQVALLVLEKGNFPETDHIQNNSKNISEQPVNSENIQQNSATTKRSVFASQSKEQNANSADASTLSKSHKDSDIDGLSCSSLPTELNSVFYGAKDNCSVVQSIEHVTPPSVSPKLSSVIKGCKSSLDHIKGNSSKKLLSKLTSYNSTPNLVDNSDEEDIRNEFNRSLYRNRSSENLVTPPIHFLNPHQALSDIYKKYSFRKGSSSNVHPVPSVPIRKKKLKKLQDIYDYSNPENTFEVSIHKSSRGLGLSICGGTGIQGRDTFSQLIRIRKLYPLQPALECGKLQLGDVILSVNGTNMVGLTNTEALEVLRTTPADVVLEVFRPSKSLIPCFSSFKDGMWPFCDSSSSSASSSLSRTENSYNVETGEFEVTLIKRGGSLGFSISKKDSLPDLPDEGIFVKALIREPAISDGRIQPGDKIIQVNGVTVSTMTHAEAIEFIRQAPNSVTLKLYRSEQPPITPGYTEKDNQINKPLRWEAVELLNDRMKHKESGDEGSAGKRKIKRKLDRFSNAPSNASTESSSTSSSSSSGQEQVIEESTKSDVTTDLNVEESFLQRNLRPKSLDVLNSSDRKRLPAYTDEESFHRQCSVMCTNVDSKSKTVNNTNVSPAKKGFKNLLKWRGSTLPHSEDDISPDVVPQVNFSISSTSNEQSLASQDSASDDEKPVPFPRTTSCATEWVNTFDVDLDRGWHGRLGFSLFDPPTSSQESPRSLLPNAPEVKAVHPGSLADKDGRIKAGDRLVEANRESFLGKPAAEVIDSLRKTRGLIRMVFCRLEKRM